MKKKMKKRLAFLLTAVLLAGTLPLSDLSPVQAATSITLKNPVKDGKDGKDITTWDCVWFGNYWQEDTNGDGKADKDDEQTPIKWRVLSVKGDDAFLMADKNLESKRYHEEKGPDVTWKTCTIRSWLNGYWGKENAAGKDYRGEGFIDYAFTDAENQAIKTATVKTGEDSVTGVDGGIETSDKIYFLSAEEATDPAYGFVTSKTEFSKSRRALNTAFNIDQGAYTSHGEETEGNGFWWLRSQSVNQQCADYVGSLGWIDKIEVYNRETVVRPVLHLDLSSTVWSYAGTVTSEGTAEETTPPAPEPQPEEPGLKNPVKSKKGITTWDCVWFGNYWQEDTNGDGKADKDDEQTPIKWRVLSVKDDDAFLMADKNLEFKCYHDQRADVTWETCTIRSWLNGYGGKENAAGKDYRGEGFIDYAFTDAENQAIKTATVKNGEDSVTGVDGGNDTSDKIYFLSAEEAMNRYYGFSPSDTAHAKNRRALNTAFNIDQGAYTSHGEETEGNGFWWLRSKSANQNAAYVGSLGWIDKIEVYNRETVVRPVVHLDLSSEGWSYAGTATSEGEGFELELNQKYLDLGVGEKEHLSLKIFDTEEYQLQWMSSDENVASVDANGRVTAVSAGTAEIKAIVTYHNREYSIRIPVTVSGAGETPKKYDLEVPADCTFETQNTGYAAVSAKSLNIKNTGNTTVTNIKATLAGTDADAFTLDTDGMQTTLAPSAETIVSIKPNTGLKAGIWKAELKITGDTGVVKSVPIAFTVKESELPPTHTCKFGKNWKSNGKNHWHECSCGQKSDIAAHKKDKGSVTKAPTTTKTGIRTYKCSVCGYVMRTEKIDKLPPTQEEIRKNSEKLDSGISIGWKGNNLALSWGKADGAEGYDIFAAPCGKTKLDAKSLIRTVKGQTTSTSLSKISGRKISGKEVYKTKVKAWRYVNGKKAYDGSSRVYYVAGKTHPKYTNAKQLKAAKKTYALKKGKSVRIKVTIVKQSTKKKLLPKSYGAALQYASGNKTIATVTQNGTVKAKKKGTCYITVTALNGVKTKIKITVK